MMVYLDPAMTSTAAALLDSPSGDLPVCIYWRSARHVMIAVFFFSFDFHF